MSDYVETQLSLLDPVHNVEVRNLPDKTVIVTALLAGHTDNDVEEVKDRASSLGFYFSESTSLQGSYALKFTKPDKDQGW